MIGTMVLVLMGCGSAVFAGNAAGAVSEGVGTLGVALAFGLSVIAMAYTIGGVSGCHINPAITLGVFLSGRMKGKEAGMYMLFQVIGAIIASAILYILTTVGGHNGPTATGSNSFGEGMMLQAFIAEAVFTFIFVLVVLGSTDEKKGAGNLAGLAIGLTLVLVHGHRFDIGIGAYRLHPHHRDIRQPGPQHRSGTFRRRNGTLPIVALHRRPVRRRSTERMGLENLCGKEIILVSCFIKRVGSKRINPFYNKKHAFPLVYT